jgi:hypothetical protein
LTKREREGGGRETNLVVTPTEVSDCLGLGLGLGFGRRCKVLKVPIGLTLGLGLRTSRVARLWRVDIVIVTKGKVLVLLGIGLDAGPLGSGGFVFVALVKKAAGLEVLATTRLGGDLVRRRRGRG